MRLPLHTSYSQLLEKVRASHDQGRRTDQIDRADTDLARLYCYAYRIHTIGAYHATRLVLTEHPVQDPVARAHLQRAVEQLDDLANQGMELVPDDFRAVISTFFYYDRGVRRVLDALDKSPAAEDTIIVLWSDHGWHLGEKGHWHKRTLWEEATRVPFLIAAPGTGQPGQRCLQPVSLVDIFPTLIELCGLPRVKKLDGISLVPWLHEPGKTRKRPAITIEESGHVAIRGMHYRVIRYTTGQWEVYDHRNDPGERTNLAMDPSHTSTIEEARQWIPAAPASPADSKGAFLFDHRKFTWTHKKNGQVIKGK